MLEKQKRPSAKKLYSILKKVQQNPEAYDVNMEMLVGGTTSKRETKLFTSNNLTGHEIHQVKLKNACLLDADLKCFLTFAEHLEMLNIFLHQKSPKIKKSDDVEINDAFYE